MTKVEAFERFIKTWTGRCSWVSIVALAVLLCVAIVDIVGGKVLGQPIPGSIDIIGLLGGIITAFSLGQTQFLDRHIRVDFVARLLPQRIQRLITGITAVVCLAFALVICGTCLEYAQSLLESGEKSITLSIPFFPFAYAMVFAFVPLILAFFRELLIAITGATKK